VSKTLKTYKLRGFWVNRTPGFPRPVGSWTPGDRSGATTVRGLGETVEKETAD